MQKNIYTDLALEARELNPALSGVEEEKEEGQGLAVSRIRVTTQGAAEKLGKAMGQYVTLDAPGLVDRPLDLSVGVLGQHLFHIFNGSGSTFFVDFFAQ